MNGGSRPPAGLVCRLSRVPGVSARVKRVSVIFFSHTSLYSVYSILWNPNLTSTKRGGEGGGGGCGEGREIVESFLITGGRYIGVLFHKFCYN